MINSCGIISLSGDNMDNNMEVRHLGREAKTALEIAIVTLAPSELVERLALVAGLLEALAEIPAGSPPTATLMPKTVQRAQRVLAEWRKWERANVKHVSA